MRRSENNYLFLDRDGDGIAKREDRTSDSLRILKSFAKSLDTHTAFFSPEEAYEMRLSLEKQFEGVGVVLSEGIDGVMIAELIEGSPAEQSGQIKVNDLLVEIDGKSLRICEFRRGPRALEEERPVGNHPWIQTARSHVQEREFFPRISAENGPLR